MFGFGWGGPHGPHQGRMFHRRGGPHAGPRQGPPWGGHEGPGMRRPLRFLIEHLDLDDAQASEVSKAIDALRLEREQAALDERRARSRIADLVEAEPLDPVALAAAAGVRVEAASRLRDATVSAITKVHAALKPEQRAKLGMLLRNGPFAL